MGHRRTTPAPRWTSGAHTNETTPPTDGPIVLSGTGHPALGASLAGSLEAKLGACSFERFPDGELHVEVQEPVSGRWVSIVGPTCAPVAENLLELLLVGDACWRSGALRMDAVIPYFGYARSDRRRREGEPLGSRLLARLLGLGGFDRVFVVDLHSGAIEGSFDVPLVHLTAVPALVEAIRPHARRDSIVVSPDLGAVKLAREYARRLELPLALVDKSRASATEVTAHGVVGPVKGLAPIVVDDMISTGGTIAAAVEALSAAGSAPEVMVAASHLLLAGSARERLERLPIRRLFSTDSVPQMLGLKWPHDIVPLAPMLAEAVRRLEDGRPLADLSAAR